ncbi:MAG: hypothetical protein AABX89_03715 [Candidatus Thermoplasmatota archaeon]
MRTILLVGLLSTMALAGCTSGPGLYTCLAGPGAGTEIDLATVAGSDAEGFNPESACPQPVAPSTAFVNLPLTFQAYTPATVTWTVLPGSYAEGHAMLSVLKGSHHPITAAAPTAADYAFEYGKKEHQNIPTDPFAQTLTFDAPGTRYVRLFANVRGEGLTETPYWSEEVKITIDPVAATGNTVTITKPAGEFQGKLVADSAFKLGDAVQITNDDLRPQTFSFVKVPPGFTKPQDVELANGATSAPLLLNIPGGYTVSVNSLPGAQEFTFNVPLPE